MPVDHAHSQTTTDRAAILISAACVVHCLLLPIGVIAFPVLATSFLSEGTFHTVLLWVILPTSLFALALGCRRHRDPAVIALGASGLLLLALAVIAIHPTYGEGSERVASLVGSVALIAAHLRNQRLCRSDCHT